MGTSICRPKEYTGERDIHFDWAEKKGKDGLKAYMEEKNMVSLDGLPTKLMENGRGET